jgi:hypothetical protein
VVKPFRGVIYLVSNKVNQKQYVGLTTRSLKRRMQSHIAAAERGKGGPDTIQEAIRQFSRNAFSIKQIGSADTIEELAEAEIRFIDELGTLSPSGYNRNRGGATIVHDRSPI